MNAFAKRAVVFMMAVTMTFTSGGVAVYADEVTDAVQVAEDATQTAEEVTQTAEETTADAEDVQEPEVAKTINYVQVYSAKIYSAKSTKSKYKVDTLQWKTEVTVVVRGKTWTSIEYNGTTAYIKTKYLAENPIVIDYTEESYKKYTKKKTKIYKAPSVYSSTSGSYKKNSHLTCLGTCGKFTVVKKGSKEVFVKTSYLQDNKVKTTSKGAAVAKYAKKFKGNPYKWGGTSLTHGADCSGFTMSVYKKFGVKLPHSSSAQRKYGKAVKLKNAKAGDLVCYSGHVGIYLGKGKIIHASNPRGGIKISSVHIMKIVTIRRLV